MNRKQKVKIAADILMTLALLFLMPYEMIGEAAHEWIGNLRKGKYTPLRVVQTILVLAVLIRIIPNSV